METETDETHNHKITICEVLNESPYHFRFCAPGRRYSRTHEKLTAKLDGDFKLIYCPLLQNELIEKWRNKGYTDEQIRELLS